MKAGFVAAGVVVAVCAAWLGVAAVSGQRVEKSLREIPATAQAQWPMVRVADERYERHLFGATHTFTLRADCDAPEPGASAPQPAITIVQHIKHGPFPGMAGFGAATVDTELALDADTRREVARFFGTEQPIQAHTSVAFSGASHTHFSVARFHTTREPGEAVDFQGLTGDVDSSAGALDYDVRMPSISIASAASAPVSLHTTLTGTHLHAHAEGAGDVTLRASKSQGEVQSFEFALASPDGSGAHSMSLGPLKFSQDTAFDKGLMNAVARADGVGRIDDTRLDRIEIQSTMKRFDMATYQGFVRRLLSVDPKTCGKAPDPATLMASPEAQAALMRMLSANPEISLDRLVVEVAGKRAELRYAIGVEGFTATDARLPLLNGLMTRGYGTLWVDLPEDWVQRSMAYVARQAGQASGATDQAALAEMMLGKVIDQGFVIRDAGMLRSEMAFRAGRATVNGKPVGAAPSGAVADAAPASPL